MAGRHSKVHELLDRRELDELEAFAREPARTVDECKEWLEARGYVVSRSAVHRWMRGFLADDRISAAVEVSRGVMASMRAGSGTADLVDAATLMLVQATQDTLVELQASGAVETKDLQRMSAALRNSTATKRAIEQMREEMAARQKAAADEARKVADAGGSAEQVVAVIQKAFGIG